MMWFMFMYFFAALANQSDSQAIYKTAENGVGAVYTMTNGSPMNQVVVFRLDFNGRLTWARAVNTNGVGSNATSSDPLFSQGAMVVYANYLFVVNAGSDSLSVFAINPLDATELNLLAVAPTYGTYPISVAVNAVYACVLTGGNVTGIRCFTYDFLGLHHIPWFDRDLTSLVSQSVPPAGVAGTLSQILFTSDDLSLLVAVKGYNSSHPGYLLSYRLTNDGTALSLKPSRLLPQDAIQPLSMTLVGPTGWLITDPGAKGVITLSSSPITGTSYDHGLTRIDLAAADHLCRSTYSPRTGSYYIVGAQPPTVVELAVDLYSSSKPVQILRYYSIAENIGALDATVASLLGHDYLYVLGPRGAAISTFRLDGASNAVAMGAVAAQQGNIDARPNLSGIAAFIQYYP